MVRFSVGLLTNGGWEVGGQDAAKGFLLPVVQSGDFIVGESTLAPSARKDFSRRAAERVGELLRRVINPSGVTVANQLS